METEQPVLTVAIATLAARFPNLDLAKLPQLAAVRYVVFVQGEPATRLAAVRPDVSLTVLPGTGVARSRNAALDGVDTELLLFGDDDLDVDPDGLRGIVSSFRRFPDADFVCARVADPQGRDRKRYARSGAAVRRWNCAKVGTPEIALRVSSLRTKPVRFDERFGAGSALPLGDEYVFLCDALRAGLAGRHVDVTVAAHSHHSSGITSSTEDLPVRRAVFIRALGPWLSRPARLAFVVRHRSWFRTWQAARDFVSGGGWLDPGR